MTPTPSRLSTWSSPAAPISRGVMRGSHHGPCAIRLTSEAIVPHATPTPTISIASLMDLSQAKRVVLMIHGLAPMTQRKPRSIAAAPNARKIWLKKKVLTLSNRSTTGVIGVDATNLAITRQIEVITR